MRLARMTLVAGLAITATVATAASTSDALPARAQVEPLALDPGPWTLTGEVSGTVDFDRENTRFHFFGQFPVAAQIEVTTAGDVNGDWVVGGDATFDLTGGGGAFTATADVSVSGSGLVGGSNQELLLVGPVALDGLAVVDVAGRQTSAPINQTIDATMRWRVLGEACNRVWGEWVFTGDVNFQQEGFAIEIEGVWSGTRDVDAVRADAAALLQSIWGDAEPSSDSPIRLLRESASLIRSYNTFVDSHPNWTTSQVISLADKAEALLLSFDAISECDRELFGDELLQTFVNGLTHSVQGLLIGFNGIDGVPPSDAFVHLSHLGARVGAFGAGAANPAQAVAAEEAMRLAGQKILDANVDPADNRVFVNEDTTRVVATGAAMGWSFNTGFGLTPAGEIWEGTFGEAAPGTGEGDGT